MRHSWSGIGVLVLLVTSGPAASRCPYPDTGLFQVGRDEKGYFVRAKPAEGFSRVSAHAWVNPVVDYLAEAKGTTAFYFGEGMTEKALEANEWRGGGGGGGEKGGVPRGGGGGGRPPRDGGGGGAPGGHGGGGRRGVAEAPGQ